MSEDSHPLVDGDTHRTASGDPLLSVRDLGTVFHTDEGIVRAVDGVSFDVRPGETVCLVGESGSGKTVAAESITGLIEAPPGEITGGTVRFDGRDLTELSDRALREVRGAEIAHVFQNPQDALNPVYRVGTQIAEVIRIHEDVGPRAARRRAIELLDRVGIPDPGARVDSYPHELSGGMKQRVMIAIALAGRPDLLIADEPTTALDVTIQAEILELLAELQAELGMAIVFVTHDLGVVARIADEVVVVYAGKVMERGPVEAVFESPAHPYTRALLSCLPGRGRRTRSIGGELPSAIDPPPGCRFADRCPYAISDCRTGEQPPLEAVSPVDRDGNVDEGGDGDTNEGRAGGGRGGDAAGDHVASCIFYREGYDAAHLEADVDWAGTGSAATRTDRTDRTGGEDPDG